MIRSCFVLLFLVVGVANSICQNNNKLQTISQIASDDSIVVSAIDALLVYPLTSDKSIEEKKVNCFRNRFDFTNIKNTKLISKAKAEKKGIPNVPKDGVLFVTTKKGYYFNFSCE